MGILIGYARCSTDRQDLAAQRRILHELGVSDDRLYLDHGLTGTNRARPGLEQALAAVREGDTLTWRAEQHAADSRDACGLHLARRRRAGARASADGGLDQSSISLARRSMFR
jgi:hypothetical protein